MATFVLASPVTENVPLIISEEGEGGDEEVTKDTKPISVLRA